VEHGPGVRPGLSSNRVRAIAVDRANSLWPGTVQTEFSQSRSSGCDQMQGYLFARPQRACDAEAAIRGASPGLDLARISEAAEMAGTLQPQ
jgi:hypothetical protein